MPANRNALIRYKTLDKCLQNRYRKWTLDDLIEACSEALYEYEGQDAGVSRRTVQGDLQVMRSDKLGYNAPIVVTDKKYYSYEDPDYSITNIPLSEQDLTMLSEAVEFMKQFQGFSHFKGLEGMVQKLEDHIYSAKTNTQSVIDIEKNDNLKGLEHLSFLYNSIISKSCVELVYQSFKARQAATFTFHPYLLKEWRNRWFLVGKKNAENNLLFLALDRIESLAQSNKSYREPTDFDPATFFKDAIGVSVSPNVSPLKVQLFVSQLHAPYVLTKPLHHSQKLLSRHYYGITIELTVQHNFELEKEILSFGEGVKVIAPEKLKRIIKMRLNNGVDLYETELTEKGLAAVKNQLQHKGFAILNKLYTKRELRKIYPLLPNPKNPIVSPSTVHLEPDKYNEKTFGIRQFLQKQPELIPLLFNQNLKNLITSIDPMAFLVKSIFFDKPQTANWFLPWHQDIPINVKEKIAVENYEKWTQKNGIHSVWPPQAINENCFTIRIHFDDTTESNGALKVLPGSHRKRFSQEEMNLITQNSTPSNCEVQAGGVQIMKPLLLHSSSKAASQKRRRIIHLEFASLELEGGLEWLERQVVL